MKCSSIVINSFNQTPYMISTVYAPKTAYLRYSFGEIVHTEPLDTYFESAVYQLSRTTVGLADIFKMLLIGPKLVFNLHPYSLEDTKKGGEQEFHKVICTIIQQEKITDLVDEGSVVFSNYGYLNHQQDIWSLWQFKKVKHIFLLQDR